MRNFTVQYLFNGELRLCLALGISSRVRGVDGKL